MPLQGNTKYFSLTNLFQIIQLNQYSGTLTIHHEDTKYTLYFQRGQIAFLLDKPFLQKNFSLYAKLHPLTTQEKKLWETTLQNPLLPTSQICKHIPQLPNFLSLLQQKAQELIYDLFTLNYAYFEFSRNLSSPTHQTKNPCLLSFPIQSTLLEGMRRKDEWQRIHQILPSKYQILQQTTKPLPTPLNEDPKIQEIFQQLKNPKSIQSLLLTCHQSQFEVFFHLKLLLHNQLITPLKQENIHQQFYLHLQQKNFSQAIEYLEAAFDPHQNPNPPQPLLSNLIHNKNFLLDFNPYQLTFHVCQKNLAHTLENLLLKKHLGTLKFSYQQRTKYIQLLPHQIRVFDNSPQPYLQLEQILHKMNLIRQSQLDQCLTLQNLERNQKPLGELLCQKKYLTPQQLLQAQIEKLLEDIAETLLWDNCQLTFYKNQFQLPPHQKPLYTLNTSENLSQQLIQRLQHWQKLFKKIPHPHIIFRPTNNPNTPKMNENTQQIYQLLDGKKNLHDLIQLLPISQLQIYQNLYQLLSQQLIQPYTTQELNQEIQLATQQENYLLASKLCDCGYAQTQNPHYLQQKQSLPLPNILEKPEQCPLKGDAHSFPLQEILQILDTNQICGTLQIQEIEKRQLVLKKNKIGILYPLPNHTFQNIPPQQALHDILATFHWKNAQFQFIPNYYPPHYYYSNAQKYLIEFDTQIVLMEALKQLEGMEILSPSVPSLDIIVIPANPPQNNEDKLLWETIEKQERLLDLYHHTDQKDVAQFALKIEQLLEKNILQILPLENAKQQLQNPKLTPLQYLHLCQHIQTLSPSLENAKRIEQTITDYFSNPNPLTLLPYQNIQKTDLLKILKIISQNQNSGTLLAITPYHQWAFYLSKHEIWACQLHPPNQLPQPPLSPPRLQDTIFSLLLYALTHPQTKFEYHPHLFPLAAKENQIPHISQHTIPYKFWENLLFTLTSIPHPPLPLQDQLIFTFESNPKQRQIARKKTRIFQKKTRIFSQYLLLPEEIAQLQKIYPLIEKNHNVHHIVQLSQLEKYTVWKLLATLFQNGEIRLLSHHEAQQLAENAHTSNHLQQAIQLYHYALLYNPSHTQLQQKLQKLQKLPLQQP